MIYLANILIYSSNLREYQKHVQAVLTKLREAEIQANVKKCKFHVTETKYLGLIISTNSIKMDPAKIEAICTWNILTSVKEVHSFIKFCNFYCQFIQRFSRIASELITLIKKGNANKPFRLMWTNRCKKTFQNLKNCVCEEPILAHFDPRKQCFVKLDSSDYINTGMLS